MKFGRTIKTSLYPEWSAHYLQYSDLKKEIKNRMAENQGVWTDKDEDDFVEELRMELDKVYSFQKSKVSELTGRIENVNTEVHQLLATRDEHERAAREGAHPPPPASDDGEGHGKGVYRARDDAGSDDELDSEADEFEDHFFELEEQLAVVIADVHDLSLIHI